MEAILFPTDMNHHHTYGLVSYIMIDDGFIRARTTAGIRTRFLRSMSAVNGSTPSRYNEYLAPQLPVYMFDGEFLIATGHGEEAAGLPVFEIRCMCMPQLAYGGRGTLKCVSLASWPSSSAHDFSVSITVNALVG